jgi:hypothetical protein
MLYIYELREGWSTMKKWAFAGVLLFVLVTIAALWVFHGSWLSSSGTGFSLVQASDNSVLLSDADALSFNLTSQEITFTDAASQRLLQVGDSLYQFNNTVSIRVNGEEIYQGIFRVSTMSALPALPKIAIAFPSIQFPSGVENDHALRLFYPSFQPPSDISEMNAKLTQYFEGTNRLIR